MPMNHIKRILKSELVQEIRNKIKLSIVNTINHMNSFNFKLTHMNRNSILITKIFIFLDHIAINYYETPRGAKGVICNGFHFVKEKAFGKTINW